MARQHALRRRGTAYGTSSKGDVTDALTGTPLKRILDIE
jgi:hypothetical protein